MTRAAHVPVLLDELVGSLDPQPGDVAVDCTFGAGGHARLVAERLGPEGTLIAIDRDPIAEERFAELAAEVPCATRFIRASFADGLDVLAHEGVRADIVYLDLGMSSMQVDTLERGFSYVYDAPLDMRMDPRQELTARDVVNGWDERGLIERAQGAGGGALLAPDRARDHAAAGARSRSRRRRSSSTSSPPRSPPRRASARAIRPSAPSKPSGSS